MAGIAIVLDLLRKNPNFHSSTGSFTAFTASAASVAAATPFAYRFLFGVPKTPVAYCDAAAGLTDDYLSDVRRVAGKFLQHDALIYSTKEYKIELKPIFSAFEYRTFAMTALRSFLLFYLPLLEPKMDMEENDDDFLNDSPEEGHIDLVVPFKKSVKQIGRETTVVTTRRVLERLALHHISQRMAWKLLKDVRQSAMRKAGRGMSTHVYMFRVTRTTFRGHMLGVAASWIVQVGIEMYRCLSRLIKSEEDSDKAEVIKEAKVLGNKVTGISIRCGASLVFASIGAGIGAVLIRPSAGQWIGCAIGDLAGPIAVSLCLEKVLHSSL